MTRVPEDIASGVDVMRARLEVVVDRDAGGVELYRGIFEAEVEVWRAPGRDQDFIDTDGFFGAATEETHAVAEPIFDHRQCTGLGE